MRATVCGPMLRLASPHIHRHTAWNSNRAVRCRVLVLAPEYVYVIISGLGGNEASAVFETTVPDRTQRSPPEGDEVKFASKD